MSQIILNRIKILIMVKITAIILLFLLVLLWYNPLSFVFMFLDLLFVIGTIADYIAYTVLKSLNKNLEATYKKYEKIHDKDNRTPINQSPGSEVQRSES